MKKFIGIIGVMAIALAMFFSTSDVQSLSNTDLASLISLNSADAECEKTTDQQNDGNCTGLGRCSRQVQGTECRA